MITIRRIIVLLTVLVNVGAVFASAPSATTAATALRCGQGLLRLDGVVTSQPYLHPAAATSFDHVRMAVRSATGADALATLGDALRFPSFTTDKPGVAERSWHKAGRAIDLDQRLPWRVVPDGAFFRLWLDGVDITAILIDHGWSRIAAQGSISEWWHFEYRPTGLTWDRAMAQVWPHNEQIVLAACLPVRADRPAGMAVLPLRVPDQPPTRSSSTMIAYPLLALGVVVVGEDHGTPPFVQRSLPAQAHRQPIAVRQYPIVEAQ